MFAGKAILWLLFAQKQGAPLGYLLLACVACAVLRSVYLAGAAGES